MKKIKIKTPAGRVKFHKRRGHSNFPVCTNCGAKLHGVPKGTRFELRNTSASESGPNRAYGSQLCSACAKELFRQKARSV